MVSPTNKLIFTAAAVFYDYSKTHNKYTLNLHNTNED